jgi:eukaryotic-like serine/threonine-protein kinase
MIDVVGEGQRLIVIEGPSRPYRLMTSAWPAIALACLFGAQRWDDGGALASGARLRLSEGGAGVMLVGISVAVLALLLRGWRTTTYRFDRGLGTIEVTQAGPLRASAVRRLGVAGVSSLLERRTSGQRSLELVLDDGSALVIARERESRGGLDRVARELGGLLGRSIELDVGVVIAERFEIEQRLERRTRGAVYRALDRRSGVRVALRLVPLPAAGARFERELARFAGIEHARVARSVSHGSTPAGQAFVVTDWVEGEELSQVLARGALGLSESLRVLTGAAQALSALHLAGVVHANLGPGSFLVDVQGSGDPTLIDLGAEAEALRYVAPEQVVAGREPTPAADVFALGCLFYACLAGEAPFAAAREVSSLARIRFDPAEPLRALRPGVPESWAALATRLLAKDAAARPADASALLAELERLPPPGPESGAFVRRARERAASSPADPIGVAVVLARPARASSVSGTANELAVAALTSPLRRSGVLLERLGDGSLIACASSALGAADPLRAAACAASCLQELLPQTPLALACAFSGAEPARVADAVDAAARVLERAPDGPGTYLDAASAERLDQRSFDVDRDLGLLRGERLELDPESPLLGKPTAFAGRGLELLELETFVRLALAGARERFAWVLGHAGIGKSRLAREIVRRLPERHPNSVVLIGAGDPARQGSPYLLLADALRGHASIPLGGELGAARQRLEQLCTKVEPEARGRVRDFLGELCGVPFPDTGNPPLAAARRDPRVMRQQVRMAFREWLASESTERAVVLVLEDVQWGDALTLELLSEVRDEPDAARLCVLAFARPEVEAVFPALFTERTGWSLVLGPLHAQASHALVGSVLGPALAAEIGANLVQRAAGNPLLLEELLRAQVASKAEVRGGAREALSLRLAQLGPEARRWLGLAGMIGRRCWASAVQELGGKAPVERWLDLLVELELLTPSEPSRRAGEVEYAFRHALLAEVAVEQLGDEERQAAALGFVRWLEARGERDAMLLARHGEQGGGARSSELYMRAAQQSLAQHDYVEALARASRGQAAGASGELLGELLRIQASAYHSLGHWTQASQLGLEALELLPFGGPLWCVCAEQLMGVLANVGDFKRSEELSEELAHLTPAPEARTAYMRALHAQLEGYALSGDHERGRACLAFIDGLGELIGDDVVSRGQVALWRAVYDFILGDDASAALERAQRAEADLAVGLVQYQRSMACSVQAFIYWALGCLEQSERMARRASSLALALGDTHHAAIAESFLGLALAEQSGPESLLEAEGCARRVVELQNSPLFEATSRSLSARIALARGDFALAVADSRRARVAFAGMPPYALMASATLLEALTRQGRHGEAVEQAHEDLTLLDELGGPVYCDVMFGVAAAEALFESGDHASAASVLGEALRQIELRSSKIVDEGTKRAYLGGRREVRRAFELKEQWLREG